MLSAGVVVLLFRAKIPSQPNYIRTLNESIA